VKRMIVFALSLACAGTALAQQGKGSGNAAFDNLDRNADGFLSRGEIAGDRELEKRFVRFDVDKDGRWNVSEFIKANQDNDGRILTDTTITAKVKATLLAERGIPSTSISVETYESRVLLSGFVDSESVKTKAGKLVAGISGVKQVQNNLVVK
jgi:Ca2+-binding EF-hand superfamily protein